MAGALLVPTATTRVTRGRWQNFMQSRELPEAWARILLARGSCRVRSWTAGIPPAKPMTRMPLRTPIPLARLPRRTDRCPASPTTLSVVTPPPTLSLSTPRRRASTPCCSLTATRGRWAACVGCVLCLRCCVRC